MPNQLSFDDSPSAQREQLEQLTKAYFKLHDEVHQLYEFCRTTFLAMHFDLCTDEDMDPDGKWKTHSLVRGISDKHDEELGEIIHQLTSIDRSAYECLREVHRGSFNG